ncbi:MAG: molecular chaperone TorD family protein [Acidobacteria bacterium]|nr:molecular chaperone TorD family protein [Acidobacteriota bacterium]
MSVTDAALARAVVYRALSLGFQTPTAERLRRMGAHERFATVVAALRQLSLATESGGRRASLSRLRSRYGEARRSAGGAKAAGEPRRSAESLALHPEASDALVSLTIPNVDTLTASFVRLFGHTTRGLICACETEYGADNQFHQPQQLADIAGYYLAFGLRPALAADERADHVACQCEFMDFLNRKEALLLSSHARDEATLDATRDAARTFLRDHLGHFGRAFATRLAVEDADGLFGRLGAVLLDLLDAECRRLAIAEGPIDLVVRPEMEDDAPMACGTAPELIQIQRRP